MIEQPHLLPECYADTLLVNMLIRSTANHQRSISVVLKSLKETFSKRKAVGIIDDDKSKPDYYKEFIIVKETPNYRYLSHPNKKHYLIVLKKDVEHFIFACAESVNYSHKYLTDVETLKKYTKLINVDEGVKNLFNTLIQKEAKPLIEIQKIILSHID